QAAAEASAAGLNAQVLDADTTGKAFYLVDAVVPDAAALAAAAGTVVYADAVQLVLARPATEEEAQPEALAGRGLRASRIEAGPYALAGQAAPASFPRLPAAGADPFVASLLPQVTPETLRFIVADLSGERPVDVGSRSVTFKTRYFFGGQIQDVETYLYQFYSRLGLPVAYVPWTYGNYSGRNVIAEMRGTVHPERIWLIGGHFDSNSNTPYSSAPGADDNATGIAATMALAAVLAPYHFADTVRFVNFSAEELGEWGSKRYAATLKQAGAQVMGYIDLDMIGYDGNGDRVMEAHTGTAAGSINLGTAFASANSRYGQGLIVELKSASASNFSDHSSFWTYGYPAFLAIENFYPDGTTPADRNPWYHNTGDRIGLVNFDYVVRFARTGLATIAELAGLQPPPPPPTSLPTVRPRVCQERVANGGFELNASWVFTPTETTAVYTTTLSYAGLRSARLGLQPGEPVTLRPAGTVETNLLGEVAAANGSFSSAYQAIDLPAEADDITLRYRSLPGTAATAGDYQRALLLKSSDHSLVATLGQELANDTTWRDLAFDLTAYRGQSLVLYFEIYNHDLTANKPTWLYLDDVSVQSCTGPNLVPAAYLPRLIR
ncbi:MAG TPA: M20/M25/M40 family metallo-hydrolase, partial [Anaerolineae bacterium]